MHNKGKQTVCILVCRNKELMMDRLRQEQYNDLNAEHIRQKQIMVNEFKQAQDLFKKRISDLETA